MHFTRWIIVTLILSFSSYAYAKDYTVTIPDSEQARVEAAIAGAYSTTVPKCLANFLFATVKNHEVNKAVRDSESIARTSKEADVDSKLIVTVK